MPVLNLDLGGLGGGPWVRLLSSASLLGMITLASTRAIIGPSLCGGLQNACAAHIAMNGQSLAQSDADACSGQHGMSSGIVIAACPSAEECISEAIAIVGIASGARINPTTARIAKTARMVPKNFMRLS
jgi:hypothetical protein